MRLRQILSLIFLLVSLGLLGWVIYFISHLYVDAVAGNCTLSTRFTRIKNNLSIHGDLFTAAVAECMEDYFELHLRVVIWSMLGLVLCVSFVGIGFFLYYYQGNKKKNA